MIGKTTTSTFKTSDKQMPQESFLVSLTFRISFLVLLTLVPMFLLVLTYFITNNLQEERRAFIDQLSFKIGAQAKTDAENFQYLPNKSVFIYKEALSGVDKNKIEGIKEQLLTDNSLGGNPPLGLFHSAKTESVFEGYSSQLYQEKFNKNIVEKHNALIAAEVYDIASGHDDRQSTQAKVDFENKYLALYANQLFWIDNPFEAPFFVDTINKDDFMRVIGNTNAIERIQKAHDLIKSKDNKGCDR